jgi:hypothetical protein
MAETYKGSRKSVFLLGGVDDLEGQLDQSARMHVCKNDIAKSCMNEGFEMAFLGTLRRCVRSWLLQNRNEGR